MAKRFAVVLLGWMLCLGLASISQALAQDAGAPCGRDLNGRPYPCRLPNPSANIEAACLTTARPENCVPYHQNACQMNGIARACRLFELGRNCFGGDPRACDYYTAMLRANTACALDRNPSACQWLQQQNF